MERVQSIAVSDGELIGYQDMVVVVLCLYVGIPLIKRERTESNKVMFYFPADDRRVQEISSKRLRGQKIPIDDAASFIQCISYFHRLCRDTQ